MKNLISTFSLLWICMAGLGQGLLLGPGDSYSFEFTSLPYLRPANPTESVWGLAVDFTGDSFKGGETAMVERFRDTLFDPPVTDALTLGAPSGPNSTTAYLFPRPNDQPFWTDLQGAVKVTVTSGSARLEGITVNELVNGRLYGAYLAVPEPSTSSLLLLSAGSLVARSHYRKLTRLTKPRERQRADGRGRRSSGGTKP